MKSTSPRFMSAAIVFQLIFFQTTLTFRCAAISLTRSTLSPVTVPVLGSSWVYGGYPPYATTSFPAARSLSIGDCAAGSVETATTWSGCIADRYRDHPAITKAANAMPTLRFLYIGVEDICMFGLAVTV